MKIITTFLLTIGFIMMLLVQVNPILGQDVGNDDQTTNTGNGGENQQEDSSSSPTSTLGTGEIAGLGVAGAGATIAIVKQLLDQRKNTKRDRTTDEDAGRFIILISKFYQAKYLYPHMTDKEILDLPISNNPMSKQTLGQAITAEAELWAVGNQQYWNIPSPQMSVPTLTTVNAVKSSTAGPPTQPPPPANIPMEQQQPTSSTETTG